MLEVVFDRLVRMLSSSFRNFTSDNVDVSIDSMVSMRFDDYLKFFTCIFFLQFTFMVAQLTKIHQHDKLIPSKNTRDCADLRAIAATQNHAHTPVKPR
jgi:hypothetical protein